MNLTTTLLLTPFLTAFLVLLVPGNYRFVIRCLALLGGLVTLALGIALFERFDPAGATYQFEALLPWVSSSAFRLGLHLGVDGVADGGAIAGEGGVPKFWREKRVSKKRRQTSHL